MPLNKGQTHRFQVCIYIYIYIYVFIYIFTYIHIDVYACTAKEQGKLALHPVNKHV